MENCPYLDGCLERKYKEFSDDCYRGNYVVRRCYDSIRKLEEIMIILAEELEKDFKEEEMFMLN